MSIQSAPVIQLKYDRRGKTNRNDQSVAKAGEPHATPEASIGICPCHALRKTPGEQATANRTTPQSGSTRGATSQGSLLFRILTNMAAVYEIRKAASPEFASQSTQNNRKPYDFTVKTKAKRSATRLSAEAVALRSQARLILT